MLAVAGIVGLLVSTTSGDLARGQATAAASTSQTLVPEADAYVDASVPSGHYGTATTLRVDSSPVQRSFLRFNLSGVSGTVTLATLKVWAETPQSVGYDVYGVSNNTWVETTISDSNAPALAATKTGSSAAASAGAWTSVVVTPLVSSAVGNKVSFALKTTSSTALRMSSKETTTTAHKPQLIVETVPSSDTQAPSTPSGVVATAVNPTRIDISWNASSDNVGVTGYGIYKDGASSPTQTVSGSTLSYSDTAVAGGTTHSYTVDAFDAAGNRSAQSSPPQSTTTPDAPGCKTSANGTQYSVTVCLTAPAGPQTVVGPFTVSATATVTVLSGPAPPTPRVRFCVDDSGCTSGATGYALSDFKATSGVYSAALPSQKWVDGTHTLTARPWVADATGSSSSSFLGSPTPTISLTFNNGVSSPPANGNTFTPTSGTAPGAGQPLVVAAVGDGAAGESGESSVVSLINSWNPNLMLYLGDVYEKGSPSEFFNYYDNAGYGLFKSITDPAVGNHEYGFDNQASGYFGFWDTTKHYYSFDAGGWHFISLDSTTQYNQVAPGSDQYQWLQNDLSADTAQCTLVYFHHPRFNVGPEGQNTDQVRLAQLWSLMATHGGMLVLNGHDHDYQRWHPLDGNGNANPNGVTEIVVGTGGHGHQDQVAPDARMAMGNFTDFGALRLQLNPTSAHVDFVSTTSPSAPLDSADIPCNPAPVTPPPAPTLTLTPADGNSSVTGSTVYYNPAAASSFTVGASATGAATMTFPTVFGGDGVTDSSDPFSQNYSWAAAPSTAGTFSVTASNTGGDSTPTNFTVAPDSGAPSTGILCNFAPCSGTYSSTVSVSLVPSDGGSGPGATYYTLDGSDPTTSSSRVLYTAPFLLSASATVQFYTLDKVGNAEAVESQAVTISSGGGVAFVQQKSLGSSGSTASLQVPLTSASVSGDTLVAVVALAAGSSASVTGVTDSAGGTWTPGPIGYLSGANSRVEIWYRLGGPSATTVTVGISPAKAVAVNVSEWSGVATTSALDLSKNGSGASATTIATATPFTTGNATDLLIGAANYPATATPTLTSSGWSGLNPFTSGTGVHGIAAYQITTAAGGYQASWSLTAPSGGHGTAILALKGA